MNLDAWIFSAKQAWKHPVLRAATVAALAISFAGSAFFLWKTLPARHGSGTLILHYNVYFGVDEIRSWEWVFLLPAAWIILTVADVVIAYGFHHTDPHFSAALILLSCAWSIPWIITLYSLTRINV